VTVETITKTDFERVGKFNRPRVILPDGKTTLYTRATTFVDCVEDKYMLQRWQLRQAAQGFAARPELVLAAKEAEGDRNTLERLVDDALEAAGTKDGANFGSACHSLSEIIDRGEGMPDVERIKSVLAAKLGRMPSAEEIGLAQDNLDAYASGTAELKVLRIETQLVCDPLKIAGTADRLVTYEGQTYIADIKTGTIHFDPGKIAGQLAIYARSHLYDVATGERTVHGASTTRGIVIHLRDGVCKLLWIDLEAGWNYVKLAEKIREMRRLDGSALTKPLDGKPRRPSLHREIKAEATAIRRTAADLDRWIAGARTGEELRELWAEFEGKGWTDAHTQASRLRLAEIELGATEVTA
jgi:hypothetical protein